MEPTIVFNMIFFHPIYLFNCLGGAGATYASAVSEVSGSMPGSD